MIIFNINAQNAIKNMKIEMIIFLAMVNVSKRNKIVFKLPNLANVFFVLMVNIYIYIKKININNKFSLISYLIK